MHIQPVSSKFPALLNLHLAPVLRAAFKPANVAKVAAFAAGAILTTGFYFNAVISPTWAIEPEGSIVEDDLDTVEGMRWGGNRGWRYSRILEITDGLTDTVVGRVVLDRHGIDHSTAGGLVGEIIRNPFSHPEPNVWITVSIWGSQVEGCYVALVFQYAPPEEIDPESIVPTQLEIGLGEQILTLVPQTGVPARYYYGDYSYQDTEGGILGYGGRTVERSGRLYMGRHVFGVDSTAASLLSNAPEQEARTRITFSNGDSQIVPIGVETVKRWRDAYAFNPYCASADQLQAAPTASAPPPPSNVSATASPAPTPAVPQQPNPQQPNPQQPNPQQPNPQQPNPQQPSTPQRTVGEVALAGDQMLNNVQLRLEGAHVNNTGSYTANFVVENRSQSDFGFVPVFANLEDSAGQSVTARITLEEGSSGVIPPGETVRGQIYVLNRPWNESGQQGLVLIIKESTTGGRTFRLPF
jgi:hypothetical protein